MWQSMVPVVCGEEREGACEEYGVTCITVARVLRYGAECIVKYGEELNVPGCCWVWCRYGVWCCVLYGIILAGYGEVWCLEMYKSA